MELVERIRSWPGWRRYAPAAGSALVHVVAIAGVLGMAAATSPQPRPPQDEPPILSVELVTEVAPPPPARQPPTTPSTSRPAPRADEPLPIAPPKRRDQRGRPSVTAELTAPDPGSQSDDEAVALPPVPSDVPLGLKPLLQINPCSQRLERMRGDCDKRWAKLAEEGSLIVSPTLDRLAELYPDFEPEPDAQFGLPGASEKVGRVRRRSGGDAIMSAQGVMPGGPGGGTGVESTTGRLGPKNWQHQDPAFEVDDPRWLP